MSQSSSKLNILIVTDNIAEAQNVAEALEYQNFNTHFCQYNGKSVKGIPKKAPNAVLFVFSDYIEKTPFIIKTLKTHYASHTIPFIGALTRKGRVAQDVFDSIIYPPAHNTQIANRVNSMVRLAQMEREINRRILTLKKDFDIDYSLSELNLDKSFKILFIGKATPEFMVIINALQTKNVEVVAAFTSFSAFDYLHETAFDAVVMNALESSEPAFTISETMRRNAKLYHVPTLFLVNSQTFQDHELAYQKGARDIISTNAPTTEISGRILELANYHRIHTKLKDEFQSLNTNFVDTGMGIFNETFFRAHLKHLIEDMKATSQKLTLIAIKANPNASFKISKDKLNAAMDNVTHMLTSLVRMQDIPARLSKDIFVIAFPEQEREKVSTIIDRISGVIDAVSFDSGDNQSGPFTISLDTVAVEYMGYETSEAFITHALAELTGLPTSQLIAS